MGDGETGRTPGSVAVQRPRTRESVIEIRSLVPSDPFAGLSPAFSEETRVLFVVEGPKAVAAKRRVSVRTLLRQFSDGGRSLTRVRRECRADVAATLLEERVPMAAIARAIGLSSPQALGRFIRASFGLTAMQLGDELRRRAARLR